MPLYNKNDGQMQIEASAYAVYLGMGQSCGLITDVTLQAETLVHSDTRTTF